MPKPKITIDQQNPPTAELQALARSIHNLFPQWDLRLHKELDSTNAEARRMALTLGGIAWPRVFLTDFQTAGRGRQERQWVAPPGSSLLVSLSGPRKIFPEPTSALPLCVGHWVMESLQNIGLTGAELKWPNDVLVDGKKIAGILCETAGEGIVIGFGLNLRQTEEELPKIDDGKPPATSVRAILGEQFPGWLPCALTILGWVLEAIEHPPQTRALLEEYCENCATLGTSVTYQDARHGRQTGVAKGIDPTGALIVDVEGIGRRLVASPLED
ncbi:biotin--[acetyl-CoA-carboxylase] ligase [bacterium]|nr:biotin--[acetyl-CoA-carboxylase] ligase [bacterium]